MIKLGMEVSGVWPPPFYQPRQEICRRLVLLIPSISYLLSSKLSLSDPACASQSWITRA